MERKKETFYFREFNLGNHGKQHGECEAKRFNPVTGQQRDSSDAGRTNPTGRRPGSYRNYWC